VLEPHRPFAFPGGATVVASVPEGAVRALDVITSAEVEAFVTVLELGSTSTLPLADDQAAYVLKGSEAGSPVSRWPPGHTDSRVIETPVMPMPSAVSSAATGSSSSAARGRRVRANHTTSKGRRFAEPVAARSR